MKNMFFLLLALATFFSCNGDRMVQMPSINLRLQDSLTIVNTANLPVDKKIILIHFDTDCVSCQQETKDILANIEEFKDFRIFFLSIQNFDRVKLFYRVFKIHNYNNIIVGQDYEKKFPTHFNTHMTPYMAIYGKDKKLEGIIEGGGKIEKIIAQIKSPKNER